MAVTLKHITKSYHGKKILDDININISENKFTCIMGPSGDGKTTLLNILMGLVKADAGTIDGIKGKQIAAVFQEDRLCEEFDAITNIQMVFDKKNKFTDIKKELEKVVLNDYEGKPVSKLSGGMRRRVTILRACLKEADIYIMDEPFKGFDEELKVKVIYYIKEKLKGKTVIIVTHERAEVVMLEAELISFNHGIIS